MSQKIRNIAIVAHVDHGKTTLVDKLLSQSEGKNQKSDQTMDSNAIEQERGITILAKNTSIDWHGYRINIIDTPGHADFSGEVERVLGMADSVLILVDAVEGPMPQTRFVTKLALDRGFRPIVVINKVDRAQANPDNALNATFDLFAQLGATDEQLDFPVMYASGIQGISGNTLTTLQSGFDPILQKIVDFVPAPKTGAGVDLQFLVAALDYNSYVGTIGLGRIIQGEIKLGMQVEYYVDEIRKTGRISALYQLIGLEKLPIPNASAGDIVAIAGLEDISIGVTVCQVGLYAALPKVEVEQPTMSMMFMVNDSPFAGKEGKFLTSRHIESRLKRETRHNIAMRLLPGPTPDMFEVQGRGELHLSILIETMRREGFEFAVARPQVLQQEINGEMCEPYEELVVDVFPDYQGRVMEVLGNLGGQLLNLVPLHDGMVRLDYEISARALIGLQTDFLTLTAGTGLMHHTFKKFAPVDKKLQVVGRQNGSLISNGQGTALAYALFNLQERGNLLIGHATEVYEGMIIGIHARTNDLVVNPLKGKQLTNIRAAGKDENLILVPPIQLSIEKAIALIREDELVEFSPTNIRLRKRYLNENERAKAGRTNK